MTRLSVDYVNGVARSDEQEAMTDEEYAIAMALQDAADRAAFAKEERLTWTAKDFDEALHPRDDHGRFAETGGGGSSAPVAAKPGESISLPTTTAQVHDLYLRGIEGYQKELTDHGGPSLLGSSFGGVTTPEGVYDTMHVDEARPEDVTDEQRARCEEAAAKFLNDPEMQPLFDEYGTPGIVVASGLVSPDGSDAGADPSGPGVVAQWSNGTIIMYGDTAGDPNLPSTPGFSIAGADPDLALIHEYGHQIMGVIGYDSGGDASAFRNEFVKALAGIPLNGAYTDEQIQTAQETANMNAGQISEYATSSPDEAFAEAFAALYQQKQVGAAIEDTYDGGAAEAMHLIEDKIAADTKDNGTQQTLFTRTNP